MTDDNGLTREQQDVLIDQVLDEQAELFVDGVMDTIAANPHMTPRVALALARRLNKVYGG